VRKNTPSARLMWPLLRAVKYKNIDKTTNKITSIKMFTVSVIGAIIAAAPKINNTLNIQLPTTFPIAISSLPLRTAMIPVVISGNDVPIATIVKPIKTWLIPKVSARPVPPRTTNSPPIKTPAREITNKVIVRTM